MSESPETSELDTSKFVNPGDLPPADPSKMAEESTPVGDEAENASHETGSDEEDDDVPNAGGNAPVSARSYQVDVGRALQRETHDGKGEEDPGESDWQGFATEGVETSEDD